MMRNLLKVCLKRIKNKLKKLFNKKTVSIEKNNVTVKLVIKINSKD